MTYKEITKKFFPFILPLVILPEYLIDYYYYLRHSGVLTVRRNKKKLIGRIIAEYHVLEKGLTMPQPRLGFGRKNVDSLIQNCLAYISRFGANDIQLKHAVSVLLEYRRIHMDNRIEISHNLLSGIESLQKKITNLASISQFETTEEEYFKDLNNTFPLFSASRRSVRNYSNCVVPTSRLIESVKLAQNAPSSCNRQTSRVYIYSDRIQIQKILEIQGGNRGFGYLTDKLIVITSELGVSHGIYERHQIYVDGGMFAMNLLYSLHYDKIAACPLNCNFSFHKTKILRKLCHVAESEVFILMISCGNVPKSFKIAISKRYPVEEILTVI